MSTVVAPPESKFESAAAVLLRSGWEIIENGTARKGRETVPFYTAMHFTLDEEVSAVSLDELIRRCWRVEDIQSEKDRVTMRGIRG